MTFYFFSWRQVTPAGLLHEVSGGGYICSAALLCAAVVGLAKLPDRRLLACIGMAALAGPIAVDAAVNYFFAARQLLFAAPGAGSLRGRRHRKAERRSAPLGRLHLVPGFLAAATVSDYRLATIPKDGFGAQARVLAAPLPAGSCVAVAPPNHAAYY